MADVVDFAKERKDLYVPKAGAGPVEVDVPEFNFLMIDGAGAPDPTSGSDDDKNEFGRATGAIYGMIYSIKMSEKKGQQPDGYYNFKVSPFEALWWMTDGSDFDTEKRELWRWTIIMRVPEYVTPAVVAKFADQLTAKKKDDIFKQVRVEKYHEGPSVQLMHLGSYDSEGPNIQKIHDFIDASGYKKSGKHHEIYYGDPRRSAPEKLRTVIRQPFKA